MAFIEIVVHAWTCDRCGIEAIAANDGLPEGWVVAAPDGEQHWCGVCVLARAVELEQARR